MTMTVPQISALGVRGTADAIAKGELSPASVAEMVLGRISDLEGRVQAWSFLDVERLKEDARVLTAEAASGKLRGPLHGVPIGIKDEFHVQGMPTAFRDLPTPVREPEDATPVARLRAAGALIVGKTYMGVGGRTPPTRNPWNLEHTPGGSSSGSGAAVGARMVPAALAEQTGGSCLRPAAYCGVDALTPTNGRISRFGCYPFAWSLDRPGVIGLNMEDIALIFSVIAGPDPRDPTSLPYPAPPSDLHLWGLRPPRIGVVRNFFPERSQPVMQDAVEKAARRLKEAGADVRDVLLPETFALAWSAYALIFGIEGATLNAHRETMDTRPEGVANRRAASLIPATYYLQALRIRQMLYAKVLGSFRDVDALLMLAAPGPAPKVLASAADGLVLAVWSLLGYPAISINGGLSPDGLPLGLQFVAAPKEDYRLLQIGAWCESVLGRLPPPPLVRG